MYKYKPIFEYKQFSHITVIFIKPFLDKLVKIFEKSQFLKLKGEKNMNKIKIILILSIFIASIIEIGCKGDTGPQGPAGPLTAGTITGLVNLIDTNGMQPTNKGGITVSIGGTSTSVMTDSTGHWTLSNLNTGIYEIDISKNTYGSTKHLNQQLVGGGTLYIGSDFLSEAPNFNVALTTDSNGNGFVKVKGTLSWTTSQMSVRNIILFIGNQSNVSSNPANYLGINNFTVSDTATVFSVNITSATFNGFGIATGSTCYITAYSASAIPSECSRYPDQATGRFFYTSLGNQSNVLTITTPSRFINNGTRQQ